MADSSLRVDLIITEMFVGGAERCLTELAIGLRKRGDSVRVASIGTLPTGKQAALVQRLRNHGISVESADCDSALQALSAYRWLRSWIRKGQPDVVQTMLFHANVLGAFAARSAAVPVCIGGLRVAEKLGLRLVVEKRAIRQMDAVVCVSRSVERFAHEVFGRSIPPTHVIGNAVDIDTIDKTQAIDWTSIGWPRDAQVLLFVGRLHRQKGLDILVEAIEPLLSGPADDRPMRCLLVGDGPQRDELNRVATRLGPDRFQVAGWRSDPLSLIKGCRVLVLPSRYEGMPNVVLEAMAAGKPVAATAVEGVAELLGNAADGQTCVPEDPSALRELIRRLWQDEQAANELGRMNRHRAADEYQMERLTARYRDLYVARMQPEWC